MSTYRIIIKTIPDINNQPFDQNLILSPDQLFAIAIMSTALVGDDRDKYVEIRDKALRQYNIDDIIRQSGAVVLDGEAAFELDPLPGVNWLQVISDEGAKYGIMTNVTKQFTIKVEGYYRYYLLQFDNNDFYHSLWVFPQWIGKNGSKFLKYLYHGNEQHVIKI